MSYNDNFLANCLQNFDGETPEEKVDNFKLGFKAQNNPKELSRKEIFQISFLIERMQSWYGKIEKSQKIVTELELIRGDILKALA